MPVHSYFVFAAFLLVLMSLILLFLRLRGTTGDFIGIPSIDKLYFYSGKLALVATWVLFLVKAINPRLGYIYIPVPLSWIAVVLLYIGALIFFVAMFNLGKSLAVGLPGRQTKLQTRGLYRFSRNPIYIGAYLVTLGSCIYFPDLINTSFAIFGIYIHHRIIKEEEHFLPLRFGNDWLD